MSQRNSILVISSERLSISSRIAWVTALTSPLGSFGEEAPAGWVFDLDSVLGAFWARAAAHSPAAESEISIARMDFMFELSPSLELIINVEPGMSLRSR